MSEKNLFTLPIKGGCLCKATRYEISEDILKTGICHCRSCQQATGSGFYPFIVVKSDAIKITGDLKEFTKIGGSGKKVHEGFCSNCGSTLFGRPEVWPHIRTVSASSLDNPELFHPEMDAWLEDAQPWVELKSDTVKFEQNPSDTSKFKQNPN